MSQLLINEYLNELATLKRVSGAQRESVVREAFKDLLKKWGRSQNLVFIPEHEFVTTAKVRNYVDGALMHDLRVPFGYWEAKDADDDLDEEIAKKFRRGYPNTNIIFEDSTQAVLIQNGAEVVRCSTTDGSALQNLLELFFGWQRPEIAEFRKAIIQFKADLPAVLTELRRRIDQAQATNAAYQSDAADFLKQARSSINPSVTADDVREMLIQHILTEDIFARVFGADDFHRENNVAQALHALDATFWRGDVKRQTLNALEPYYAAIRSTAARISSHSEKQGFLKAIYENFYKVYNPKAADKLGVVYTPNEIVRFMIESTDWLCEKHFKKSLIDRDVNILDPATGTGTFIVELMEHFRGRPEKLAYKYLTELYANEVAILPYYVANLNIEATYAAIVGSYQEFPGLCFVDTLDNTAGLSLGKATGELFGAVSTENVERITRQNSSQISVVIGNPPYYANQQNFNDDNKSRTYKEIDERIKQTYIKLGTAQKPKQYDMYLRFLKWASDRIGDDGIIAFVSNSSFALKQSMDGVRATLEKEFNEIWILDLKGDARSSGDLRKQQGGNVFGDNIKVGIAVYFLVRKKELKGFRAFYDKVNDYMPAGEKISFFGKPMHERRMVELRPDKTHNWVGEGAVDFSDFLPIASKAAKRSRLSGDEQTIFRTFSLGLSTNRDAWLYDRSKTSLGEKVSYFIEEYDKVSPTAEKMPDVIKWSETLEDHKRAGDQERYDAARIRRVSYRPYHPLWFYQSELLVDRLSLVETFFPVGQHNSAITFSGIGSRTGHCFLAVEGPADLHFGAAVDGYNQVARYRYIGTERLDNITDWAVKQFTDRYGKAAAITRDDIFAYVYAVLHDPAYRETYALNLKREFPRIPLYPDFRRWRDWGQALLDLHIGYETVTPAPLARADTPDPRRAEGAAPAVKLKSDPEAGVVVLDADTQLSGIPAEAWRYRLGNRSAIDWVLDQHKEKTPKDPTIRARFNTYRFADHKEAVIDLLARVVTVSLETVAITDAMANLPASARDASAT